MLMRRNPQLNAHGELIHLLSIEGLPKAVLTQILDTAGTFLSVNDRQYFIFSISSGYRQTKY